MCSNINLSIAGGMNTGYLDGMSTTEYSMTIYLQLSTSLESSESEPSIQSKRTSKSNY